MNKVIQQIISQTNISEQEAWWLLEHITQQNKAMLVIRSNDLIPQEIDKLNQAITDLQNNKPLSYVIGFIPFAGTKITLQPPTLIPRPETEEWVMNAINMLKDSNIEQPKILDIGTGSGCIAIALGYHFPQAQIIAVDIKQNAVNLAEHNANINNVDNITFIKSDLFANVPASIEFDLIVSNPPYIPADVELDASVEQWEDHDALFANNQGTAIIERIAQQAPSQLKQNDLPSQIIVEIDHSHADQVITIFQKNSYATTDIQKDSFGQPRTIWAKP